MSSSSAIFSAANEFSSTPVIILDFLPVHAKKI